MDTNKEIKIHPNKQNIIVFIETMLHIKHHLRSIELLTAEEAVNSKIEYMDEIWLFCSQLNADIKNFTDKAQKVLDSLTTKKEDKEKEELDRKNAESVLRAFNEIATRLCLEVGLEDKKNV